MSPEAKLSPPPTRSRISSPGRGVASTNPSCARPGDRRPVVDRCAANRAQRGCDDGEVRELGRRALDHRAERGAVEFGQVLVDALDLETEAGGEILLVAEHDVDVRGQTAVHLAGALDAADVLPQARPVVQVVRDDCAMPRTRPRPPPRRRRASSRKALRRCRPCGTSGRRVSPNRCSQSTSPGRSWDAAVWPRSETPSAPRTPKPRSVKLSPFRTARPIAVVGDPAHH